MIPKVPLLWFAIEQYAGNQTADVAEINLQLGQRLENQITKRLVDYVWACVNNPRNDIDNPTRYCANFFYAANSANLTSGIINDLSKSSSLSDMKELLKEIIQVYQKTLQRRGVILANSPPDVWEWVRTNIPSEEYFVSAYTSGNMPAEKAIRLSGLTPLEFATMVQEKALERDLPIFQAYLKDEDVEDELPFSEDKSMQFRKLIDEELE